MIKRPLHERFSVAVARGEKFTTIREKPWPVGVPMMLYNWTGKPYRSPQRDVCAVQVIFTQAIYITHGIDGKMEYDYPCAWELWEGEGFESQAEMDEWFRAVVKPGEIVTKHLMRFRLANVKAHPPLGARASIERGVEVGVIINAGQQSGS